MRLLVWGLTAGSCLFAAAPKEVTFHKTVEPILQARCQGEEPEEIGRTVGGPTSGPLFVSQGGHGIEPRGAPGRLNAARGGGHGEREGRCCEPPGVATRNSKE